jgi:hypothetical protein
MFPSLDSGDIARLEGDRAVLPVPEPRNIQLLGTVVPPKHRLRKCSSRRQRNNILSRVADLQLAQGNLLRAAC